MARRLIGLDVGTNAVTIAEVTAGTPPRLDMFAQVALPREAMREGEVADEAAVSDAVARLRTEVGLKKASVRVGIASPRVIVRQVEMPVMTRAELASALQFQAGDLIPIPVEEAVLDFAILEGIGPSHGEGGEPTMTVLLAAAQEATIMRLVSAVEAGGLQVGAVDLIPLALTRALARRVPALVAAGGVAVEGESVGAEGIVSFGGGVTSIAVHENGVPRFVRVLGSGGRELTDAIAHDLDVPAETAEALKRALGNPAPDEMVARAHQAVDRPLSMLLDEVRSSIDYYRNQPGASRLARVVATGGSAQLPGLPQRLAALVGVPVEPADMRDLIRIGDIGFSPEELPRLEPYLPAAVGLALGGADAGTVVDLLPRTRRSAVGAKTRARINPKIAAAVGAAVLLVGGATYMEHSKASSAKSKQRAAETEMTKVKNQIARLTIASNPAGASAGLQQQAAQLLGADVGWTRFVADVGNALPPGVWLTTFQGQHTVPKAQGATATATPTGAAATAGTAAGSTSTPAAGATGTSTPGTTGCKAYESLLTGTIAIAGIAKDVPSLSAFLDALQKAGPAGNPDVTGVWLASAQQGQFGNQTMITFSINAVLSPGARSDRLQTFFKEPLCK
jgi:type IV pilus assembly protein PilM